jgi:hypothetical protein
MAVHPTLTLGLAGYWPCTETSGDRLDSLGLNTVAQAGTVTSGRFNPSFNPTIELGVSALLAGGTTNYLRITDGTKLRLNGTDYSLCCWFKPTASGQSSMLVNKYANGANNVEYSLQFDNSTPSRPYVAFLSLQTFVLYCQATQYGTLGSFPLGQWNFVIARKVASGAVEIKLNNGDWQNSYKSILNGGGTLPTSVQASGSTSKFSIGASVDSGDTASFVFRGEICNVGVWNRLLSDGECGDLWNGGYGLTYDFSYPDA